MWTIVNSWRITLGLATFSSGYPAGYPLLFKINGDILLLALDPAQEWHQKITQLKKRLLPYDTWLSRIWEALNRI